jgi:hypothetical protein
MTPQEHNLMVLMFARTHQAMAAITETLKSRDLWTGDDEKAFNRAVHENDELLLKCAARVLSDYRTIAEQEGVVTGLIT